MPRHGRGEAVTPTKDAFREIHSSNGIGAGLEIRAGWRPESAEWLAVQDKGCYLAVHGKW